LIQSQLIRAGLRWRLANHNPRVGGSSPSSDTPGSPLFKRFARYQGLRTRPPSFPSGFPRGRRGGAETQKLAAACPPTGLRARGRELANPLAGPEPWGSVSRMEGSTGTTPHTPTALTEDRLLRPEQAAWYLNVKTSWVYEAVRAGRLPCHRVGRHIRFTRSMLDDWLAKQLRA
jgi:excisionase family DNA binding protein